MEVRGTLCCPSCGHGNRSDRCFCTECGSQLSRTCGTCGRAVESSEKFCGSCGAALRGASALAERAPATYTPLHLAEKILGSRAALEGERKQVTVLFADVKGSMDLAEGLDLEEWHRVMDRFFTILAAGVHRFEGTVNQFTGDGIMALFGAPIAHEDHAQRACWAALHLQESLRAYADELRRTRGLNFSVRMGLNSGDVVVGQIGDDLRMDYTAQGHTVGLAQRTEQLAEAGRIYLTEHTAALVGGYFRLRDLGTFTLKGVRHPVHIHELEGAGASRTRFDVARARGFSRFVGRADEMAAVEAAMAPAFEGRGRVIGVVGEPGVGKSRLCHEVTERARARGVPVHIAHCVAHGKMIPFLPVLELMRDFFGVSEQDGDEAARRKIAGTLLLLDQALTDDLPLVFDFLGVADPADPPLRMDPEARQRRLFALMKRGAQARSRREPELLLLEDLHWIDGGSAPFVETLVDAVAGTRTLLLVTFRPEYHAGWMQNLHYLQLPLLPLGPEASSELLRELLGSDPSLAGLTERIAERTAGNPFFAEEIVQALADAGSLDGSKGAYRLRAPVETLVLPASVQVVLGARIDRLPEREKHVLQTAAVIGKEFGEPVLRRVEGLPEAELAAALRALSQAELVYETALYPEAEYTFKHPLTQEVAYGSQLGERRKRVHAAVARAIEATSAEKLDEQAALLAHHWERAGEALVAANWLARAAEWAGARDREAMNRHWARVRALLVDVPESAETRALGVVARSRMIHNVILLGDAGMDTAVLFAEGMALAARLEGPAPRVIMLSEYGAAQADAAGQMHEGLAHLSEGAVLGAPTAGTPIPRADQTIGIGLPRKALVWEDASGVWSLQLIQRGWRRGTRSVTTRRTSSMPSVGALAKFASCGRRLIQPRDRPRDRSVWLKPARCCPTAPPRTRRRTADSGLRTGVDGAGHSPRGAILRTSVAVRVRLRQGRNPSSCCSTSGTLSSTPSNFSGELC